MISTTVMRTSAPHLTQSPVNLSNASNALPGKILRVILSYFSEVISLRETETESIFLQISCAVGLPFIKSESPFVLSLSLTAGCVFSYIRRLQAANQAHLWVRRSRRKQLRYNPANQSIYCRLNIRKFGLLIMPHFFASPTTSFLSLTQKTQLQGHLFVILK